MVKESRLHFLGLSVRRIVPGYKSCSFFVFVVDDERKENKGFEQVLQTVGNPKSVTSEYTEA
ncbi:hypothetical protein WN51_03940 [Melipona quadrifasciata]|uniref:Uncharacterized protein n=1 Tax=Melipona quadrifasciata TaxID=166423 RepID=A0A0N0BC42_9HYME|nr:hypothetical protein WN51_03940 [Melipona quadrifasciata]